MEMIDLRDRDGKRTGEVKERTLVHRDGDLHGTAHVWLVRYRADRGSADVLLQKRSADKDSFPGYYDISSAGHSLGQRNQFSCLAFRPAAQEAEAFVVLFFLTLCLLAVRRIPRLKLRQLLCLFHRILFPVFLCIF